MIETTTPAHPPPLCEACAFAFHDRCTGYSLPALDSPTVTPKPCRCTCEPATLARARDVQDLEPIAAGGLAAPHPTREIHPAPVVTGPRPVTPSAPPRWSPARLAYAFYGVAAGGAVIGQVWVALTRIPWDAAWPVSARIAAVLPFALCLELLGMTLAAMADERQRLGERAYGYRVFSAVVAALAVGIILVGHWPHAYQVAAFGGLSGAAYTLWLLHAAARRRDALRAAGKLDDTAPSYGLHRRVRHPIVTARAAELARAGTGDRDRRTWRPLGLHESLVAADLALRAEARRPALAAAVERAVRADHSDPRMAEIAVTTLDLDRIASELEARADYAGWADRLAPAVQAHPPAGEAPAAVPHSAGDSRPEPPASLPARREPPPRGPRRDSPRSVGRPDSPRGEPPDRAETPPVADPLVAQATAASPDSDVRMAWLWHATGGRASGRTLARAGQVSPATGIRRANQWRTSPPPDPRGDSPVRATG